MFCFLYCSLCLWALFPYQHKTGLSVGLSVFVIWYNASGFSPRLCQVANFTDQHEHGCAKLREQRGVSVKMSQCIAVLVSFFR